MVTPGCGTGVAGYLLGWPLTLTSRPARTRLAWERTAITFGAVGLAMLRGEPVAGLIVLAVTPLIWALGRYVSATAPPEARSRRLLVVAVAVTGVAVVATVAALLGHGGPVRLR